MSLLRFKFVGLLLAAVWLTAPLAPANAEGWETPYDKLFEEAGDQVKHSKAKDGTEIREFLTQGGVQIRQERKDGKVRTSTFDMQHGAVLCFWEIAVTVRAALDVCEEMNRPEMAARLDTTIKKLNRFILNNALQKGTRVQMQSAVDARMRRFRHSQSAPETGRVSCAKNGQKALAFFNSYLTDVANKSEHEYQAGIDRLLSVPRLPSMNPCL
ncbi:MAG: hypothetical protein GY948_09210 [Alphaproteobacteria bacterium]|nr:hypothetical protein [Alphaproteobacteria bacterium]